MNRFVSIGLSIAVAPAILLGVGKLVESPDMVAVSELVLFRVALPVGILLVAVGLFTTGFKVMRANVSARELASETLTQARKNLSFTFLGWKVWQWTLACAISLTAFLSLGAGARNRTDQSFLYVVIGLQALFGALFLRTVLSLFQRQPVLAILGKLVALAALWYLLWGLVACQALAVRGWG